MVDYKYVGVPADVKDALHVTTSSNAPRLYMNKSVTNNIPISGYITFRYIRGVIDYLVADYKVPGENRLIPNITLDDLKRLILSRELPGLDYVDPDKNETVYDLLIAEMHQMGFIYLPPVPRTAY